VEYTPFDFSNPVYVERDFIAPGISYSHEYPQGYTAFDEAYTPYVYNPTPVENIYGPPLTYTPFEDLTAQAKPAGYQPLDLTTIQTILNAIGKK
jgi:hypothetical protein